MLSYKVILGFDAYAPISGRKRAFKVGEFVNADKKLTGNVIGIEAEESFDKTTYVVDRDVFDVCCEWTIPVD